MTTSKELMELILKPFDLRRDRVVIQAGHFYLSYDYKTRRAYPLVEEELARQGQVPPLMLRRAREQIGIFPLATFQFALEIARQFEQSVGFSTIVNDRDPAFTIDPDPVGVRQIFYQKYAADTLQVYREVWERVGKVGTFLRSGPSEACLVSETDLRSAFKDRVKKYASPRGISTRNLRLPGDGEGECEVLRNGSPTCAGEIVEWSQEVWMAGFDACINIYPVACTEYMRQCQPIRQGLGLKPLKSVHVGIFCNGDTRPQDLFQDAQLTFHL